MRLEKTKDCKGNTIKTGDTVEFNCKIQKLKKQGTIHHMTGGSFGIDDGKIRAIYKFTEVKMYGIKKIDSIYEDVFKLNLLK
jgi:hypothetical protein